MGGAKHSKGLSTHVQWHKEWVWGPVGTERAQYSQDLQALGVCSWGTASEKLMAQKTCSITVDHHTAALSTPLG